jgi:NAD(P)-dependent dehydrogenase (short-subunit alcohol dehydrogenase family)
VVTGAGRGLGRETAQLLAARGCTVVLVSRHANQLNETLERIQREGGQAWSCAVDISDRFAVERLRVDVEARAGSVSILVNAAGTFGPIQLIRESDPERWIQTLAVNTIGPYLTTRAFLNGMIQAGWGRIIQFTSAAALHPPGPLNSAYATSKVALNQFTRHLAAEIDGTGVTANVIHPGDVKTEMWAAISAEAAAMGPEAEPYRQWVHWVDQTGGDPPRKAAELVLRLVSEEASSFNGRFLWIEGGLQAPIPSWGDSASTMPWQETPT